MVARDGAGMGHLATAAATIIVVAIATSPSTEPASHTGMVGTTTSSIVDDASRDLASWASGRFAAAGLDLPDVDVVMAPDPADCGGNTAIAIHGGAKPQIKVCASPDASLLVLKRTLLHELAHVWAHEHLDGDSQNAFLALRGLSSWDDSPRWDLRGSEHAAEIITWALMDSEVQMLTLAEHDPASLAAGYELLTGSPPPAER